MNNFREKNRDRCLAILSRHDDALDSQAFSGACCITITRSSWDEEQGHKFKNISPHLQRIKAFKTLG
ncbi:Predicted esterase [Kluyvera cryocrescens]|uniref:Predicted esterase n=1 Tax=Kluyvera cryocrescens TaxID=580 RepID=A0A485A1Y9_KLUCR|nr:Predicted esterase [Kluyvera cryocrescens]